MAPNGAKRIFVLLIQTFPTFWAERICRKGPGRSKILISLTQRFGQVKISEIFYTRVRAGPKIMKYLTQGFGQVQNPEIFVARVPDHFWTPPDPTTRPVYNGRLTTKIPYTIKKPVPIWALIKTRRGHLARDHC